jgi:hypothetical protein
LIVEDRCTPLLYLELGDATPDECEARAGELTLETSVERVTWWENCLPGRTDLPMRVRDGSTLMVVEAAETFEPPPPPPSASEAHCFRRGPRPSQGCLTGRPTLGLLVVWIGPRTPEAGGTLRDWGDFVHIRHIAEAGIPGFTQISVYEHAQEVQPRYMHFYEFDRADAEATFSTMIEFVAPRLGGAESSAFGEWADLRAPGGRLYYCNTFRRLGEAEAEAVRP